MGLYIRDEDVKVRLIGKVRFTDDFEDENRMHILLLKRLINEAEGQVEQDLSPRYEAPFVTDAGDAFRNLPERPTKEILRTLCELQAVIRVLETDFGKGTVVDADNYAKQYRERYQEIINKLLKRKEEGYSTQVGWLYPPLSGLKLNYMNTEADDGYSGMVLSTSESDGDYAASRINDPAETFLNQRIEDGDNS